MRKIKILWLLFSFLLCWWFLNAEYSQELQDAYKWAYNNSITTMASIDKANMMWNITREEMAKMISNYVINILWKVPDTSKSCYFIDSNINPDLVQFVTKSCQLWLMWQWVTSFRPKDFVTRAEFGVVLSRALWWDKNEGWNTFYENHLKALKGEWIMNNISSPMDKEIRWYVMLMLMRSPTEFVEKEDNTENNLLSNDENMKVELIKFTVNGHELILDLEDNASTRALIEKLKQWDIVVNAHEYWWFEKVWDLWFSLPREDKQITTQIWDLVLYQWNQISLFYNSNSRSYTKLWKVNNISKSDLWDWNVTLVFSLIN